MTERKHQWTSGPWFVSGVRFKMNGSEWHSVNRYDEALKQDQNIACVGYDPRTGDGHPDAHLIAAAPDLYDALEILLMNIETAFPAMANLGPLINARSALNKADGL